MIVVFDHDPVWSICPVCPINPILFRNPMRT